MNTIIAYLFVGLFFVAIYHFVYEVILLPSLRQNLRFKLFVLRDRLRALKADVPAMDDEAFHAMDDHLSWYMDNLHRLTFDLVRRVETLYAQDTEFRERVAQRTAVLQRCELHEYKEINQGLTELFMNALVANSGGWAIFLIPIVIVRVCYEGLKPKVRHATALSNSELESLSCA